MESLKTIYVALVSMEHSLRTTVIMKVDKELNPCTMLLSSQIQSQIWKPHKNSHKNNF
jgi:hypothetical protein